MVASAIAVSLVMTLGATPNVAGSNDDFMQRKSGAWTYRTVAQVKTDLSVPAAPFVLETPVGQYAGQSGAKNFIDLLHGEGDPEMVAFKRQRVSELT